MIRPALASSWRLNPPVSHRPLALIASQHFLTCLAIRQPATIDSRFPGTPNIHLYRYVYPSARARHRPSSSSTATEWHTHGVHACAVSTENRTGGRTQGATKPLCSPDNSPFSRLHIPDPRLPLPSAFLLHFLSSVPLFPTRAHLGPSAGHPASRLLCQTQVQHPPACKYTTQLASLGPVPSLCSSSARFSIN